MRSKRRPLGVGVMAAVVAMLAMAVVASAAFGSSEFKTSGAFPVTIKGKGGRVTLEAEHGDSLSCEKSSLAGSITGPKTVTATLTFAGKCELKGTVTATCPTLVTKELNGEPGENLGGPVVGKTTKDGLLFTATTEPIAEYTCGSTTYKFVGGFICESRPIGRMAKTGTLVCQQTSAGEQEFTSIEIGGKVFEAGLKAESALGFFKLNEKLALSMTEELTFTNKTGGSVEVEQTA